MKKIKYNTGQFAMVGDRVSYVVRGAGRYVVFAKVESIKENHDKQLKVRTPAMSKLIAIKIENVKFIKRGK